MIRSLYTGVSGIRSHQISMDVVGNNIANVNTTAYKRQRATFAQLLSQQVVGLGRTAGGRSVNPAFIGLGVSVGSIESNFGQGAIKSTGVATDLALNGDGFFIARNAKGIRYLTRAGNFTFNRNGELVTASGLNVQGWKRDANGKILTDDLEDIKIDFSTQASPKRTENITIGGNLSADISKTDAEKTVTVSAVVYDEQGKARTVLIELEKSADLATDGYDEWTYTIKDADNPSATMTGNTGTIRFDSSGKLSHINGTAIPTDADATIDFTWDMDGNGTSESLTLNFGGYTTEGITQFSGSSTANVRSQDGRTSGELTGFSIGSDGVLRLNFSNGYQEDLYQLAIGMVNNPNGLNPIGENLYALMSEAGSLTVGRAGNEISTVVVQGSLESSNVDLVTEFTDMIVTQRGYQASARVVTTSDELLQETLQLKR